MGNKYAIFVFTFDFLKYKDLIFQTLLSRCGIYKKSCRFKTVLRLKNDMYNKNPISDIAELKAQ